VALGGEVRVQVWQQEPSPRRRPTKPSARHRVFSDDSLDDSEWEWSLLSSQRPSAAGPSAGPTHPLMLAPPTPFQDRSIKPPSSGPSNGGRKSNISKKPASEEYSYWGAELAPETSGRKVVPKQYKTEAPVVARHPVEKLVPVTVSKVSG